MECDQNFLFLENTWCMSTERKVKGKAIKYFKARKYMQNDGKMLAYINNYFSF